MASCLTFGFFKLGVDPDVGYYRTVGVHPPPASSSVSPLLIYPHYESAFAFVVGSLFVRTDGGPSLIDASIMTFFSTLCKLCGKRPHGATLFLVTLQVLTCTDTVLYSSTVIGIKPLESNTNTRFAAPFCRLKIACQNGSKQRVRMSLKKILRRLLKWRLPWLPRISSPTKSPTPSPNESPAATPAPSPIPNPTPSPIPVLYGNATSHLQSYISVSELTSSTLPCPDFFY